METQALWDHQRESLEKLRSAVRRKVRRPVLQAPPGAGKTEVAIEVVKGCLAKGRSVCFTVPLLTLCDQTVTRFLDRGVPANALGVMQGAHPDRKFGAPVQVATCQTLVRRDLPEVDVVIVDECHIQHDVIRQWMQARPEKLFIGLSATPWARGMADYWEELIVVSTIPELIQAGVLVPFRTFVPKEKADVSGVKVSQGDYAVSALSDVMREKRLTGDVVQTWLDRAEGRPTLTYCVDRAHASTICEQFRRAGVRAEYVDMNTEAEDRHGFIAGMRDGTVQVIVSIGTMTTGVDIPWCSCIQYVRPTKSPILFVQSLARGLRAHEGKADCLILDHSQTTMKLGLISEIFFDKLKPGAVKKAKPEPDDKPEPMPRECQECHYVVPPKETHCPNCGAACKMRSAIRNADGELVEIDEKKRAKLRRDLEESLKVNEDEFYAELRWWAVERGHKPGWAYHKFIVRFGHKPSRFAQTRGPRPPSPATLAFIHREAQNYARRAAYARRG